MLQMRVYCHRRLLLLFAIFTLSLVLLTPIPSLAQVDHEDLTGVKVAIYSGGGVMGSSQVALTRMFEWMNASVADVTASQILEDILDDYDILVIPGGSETICSSELESDGKDKIKDFVADGGSYFGICGGSTFAVTYLRLFDGFISPVAEPGDIIHMTTMNVNQSSIGPDLADCPENFTTMYYGSQYFSPRYGTSVQAIATYEYNDKAGMIAFEYGNGTVFLSSPHPEYEEDDDRDDTTFGDDLDDPDSEWDLLLRVSIWLINASYTEPSDQTTTLDPLIIATVSTVGLVFVVVVAIFYRKGVSTAG